MKRRVISFLTALTLCLSLCPWSLAADGEPAPCPHHPVHTEECGYAPEDGAPCAFACRLCPIQDLIDRLPRAVTEDNRARAEDQLAEILTLYAGLTGDEQDQLELSRCLDLQAQLDAASVPELLDDSSSRVQRKRLEADETMVKGPYEVSIELMFDTCGYTFTVTNDSAIRVTGTGKLYLNGSQVISKNGAGVEVQSGGYLSVEDAGLTVTGTTYGLDISSGAEVRLSGGTFTGRAAAIRTAGNDFEALLESGYGYFDTNGAPIADVASAKTVVIQLKPAEPVITWSSAAKSVNYNGSPVTAANLPNTIITVNGSAAEDLRPELQYSYRRVGGGSFTDGLPADAGDYEIKASLPERTDRKAAETDPCLRLTIDPIPGVVTPPKALNPTYSGAPLRLVDAGTAAVGAEILFEQEDGSYSRVIPTGVDAGSYTVRYRVASDNLDNYTGVGPSTMTASIQPKNITPDVTLTLDSYVYNGSKKNYQVTVKDGATVLDSSQYQVVWDDASLTAAGTYTATISHAGKNYTFADVTETVEIAEADQSGLSIDNPPEHVYYGDTVTLRTVGGTGNGSVKWSVSGPGTNVTIGQTTGVLAVKGTGIFTVKAERSVDNYETAEDTWTFAVEPKQVTARVTVASKDYDGTAAVAPSAITAAVDPGDLVDSGDGPINVSGLTGTYDNPNAGMNKTVTLDRSTVNPTWDVAKYSVSIPATATADITAKQVTVKVELSGNDLKHDGSSNPYFDYDGGEKTPSVTVTVVDIGTALDNTVLTAGDYEVSYSGNKNVGTATVTVTSRPGGNYTFTGAANFEIKDVEAVLITPPQINDWTYDGTDHVLLTGGVVSGGHLEYSSDGSSYSAAVPKGQNAGTYSVYYKVVGDGNHTDAAPVRVSVTIKPKEITPQITLASNSYVYNGSPYTPAVTVKDGGTAITNSEYTVSYRDNVNAGTATVIVSDANGGNYIVNGTAHFTIEKADPAVTPPAGKMGLKYNGTAQELVNRGGSPDGTMLYSLDNGLNYSQEAPTGAAVGQYTVTYMVKGDENHKDTGPVALLAEIEKNTVATPRISLSSNKFRYNGSQQKPDITVRDDNNRLIPEDEYTVAFSGNLVDVGTYTATITATSTSNYVIPNNSTATFEIVEADQAFLSITGRQDPVFYGDTIFLGTMGGAGGGAVTWKVDGSTNTTISSTGQLTVKDADVPITVTATCSAGANYGTVSATWDFTPGKKPITAVLTGDSKSYDGNGSATVTVSVNPGDLVDSDSISFSDKMTGDFDDANVGTNKRIIVTGAVPSASGTNAEKYEITCPATASASILPVPASINGAPMAASGLIYDAGTAQALVDASGVTAAGGTLVYSLDGAPYSWAIPKAKDAGAYTVRYMVQGDGNHTDTAAKDIQVTIDSQTVSTPQIVLTPSGAQYDGQEHKPTVTVQDSAFHVIPDSEYTVTYNTGNWTDKGTYTVTIANKPGGNYDIITNSASFSISDSDQAPLTIVNNKSGLIHYGDIFTLSAVGGSGNGAVTWTSSDTGIATVDADSGLVTVKGTGPVTITATKAATANYKASTATYPFNAQAKPVTAAVTADDKPYDGDKRTTIHIDWNGSLIGGDSIDTSQLYGEFADANVGQNKTVTIKGSYTPDSTSQKYDITIPAKATASITRATPTVTPPTADAIISGQALSQSVLSGGSASVPGGSASVPGNFAWTDGSVTVTSSASYGVTFTPSDTDNYNTVEIQVSVTVTPSASGGDTTDDDTTGGDTTGGDTTGGDTTGGDSTGGGTSGGDTTGGGTSGGGTSGGGDTTSGGTSTTSSTAGAPMQTSVRNGTAATTVSAAAVDGLVREAAAKQSESVVIKPEIAGDVTRAEVSLPAPAVSRLSSATSADLTVSTPIADVTIPNSALSALSSAGGAVSVAAEQAGNAVAVTLTANGRNVDSLPGGLTLTLPAEDAAPGTVAVLVHEDGARETVRKAVPGDGKISVPLEGSATVELVDNSKAFEDVPDASWAADAVAFASAHELFTGTSETTFSPDQPLSRAMLATVLYSLEGRPEQSLTDGFSDVSGDAWYAASVSWAVEKGITAGYGDGQFGPGDSMTREQFAVMLWKYAGSPQADGQALDFTDADQASGYAAEALRWAVANGILCGCGDGRLDPGGVATRAQAAQILKSFMENT